jgi:NAD(P)-dependent dehydrogenase (short-subunit alcohol dehydrogenase family)
MAGRLEGRVAIVTGAARGIGRGEALSLASEGAAVIVNDPGVGPDGVGQNAGPADEVVAEIKAAGGNAAANYGNVTSFKDGEAMVQQALDKFGRLDILVNNAGILRDRMIFNMSEEEWDAVIAVHLKGHFTVTRHACVLFRQQRSGRIIGTSSTSGLGNMGQANYGAAKEGIAGMIRTLARDMGKYGVTANAIRPFAATRLTVSEEMMQARERARAAGVQRASNNEISELDPTAVAPLVTYLCTDAAQNINGRVFIVGGRQIGIYPEPEPVRTMFAPGKMWTVDEIEQIFPRTVGRGVKNEWEGAQAASATTASP